MAKSLYNVKYFDYIAQDEAVRVIEAESTAEARAICWAACSPYTQGRFHFEPEDYEVWDWTNKPRFDTKEDAIKRVGVKAFEKAFEDSKKYEED